MTSHTHACTTDMAGEKTQPCKYFETGSKCGATKEPMENKAKATRAIFKEATASIFKVLSSPPLPRWPSLFTRR